MQQESSAADRRRAFTRRIDDPSEWLADRARVLTWQPGAAIAAADGVLVERIVEGDAAVEDIIARLGAELEVGSVLALSFANRFAPSLLRELLEGVPSPCAPRPSLALREQALSLGRVLRALAARGFVIEDVQERHGVVHCDMTAETRAALARDGVVVAPTAFSSRPERFFVRAVASVSKSGSVLIARGPGDDRSSVEATITQLRSFLPDAWDIVVGDAEDHESASWNSVVAASRGACIWLLRTGDRPTAELFTTMSRRAVSTFLDNKGLDNKGLDQKGGAHGLAGSMLERTLVFEVGPFVDHIRCPAVAGEEWRLRAASAETVSATLEVEGDQGLCSTPRTIDRDEALALVQRWQVPATSTTIDEAAAACEVPPWRREGRSPTISLCMIVRDEEARLGSCLGRVADVVDEIVVVDTGSRDRTVAIARSFGAKVIDVPWEDDFAKARNASLAAATGDWVLVLDADEVVDEKSLSGLRQLAASERAAGFLLHFVNTDAGKESRGLLMPRFFRRFDELRYIGAIHEQVIESLQLAATARGLGIWPCDLRVVHAGYDQQVVVERGKKERNARIFEKEVAARPDDPYCLYKYGDFLRSIDADPRQVVDVLRRAFDVLTRAHSDFARQAPFAGEVAALLALELSKLERHDEARSVIETALARFVPTPNATYVAAAIAQRFDRHLDALELFERLLAFGDKVIIVGVQEGATDWIARAGMAMSYCALGRVDRAEDILAALRIEHPDWEPVWMHSASVALSARDPGRAIAILGEGARWHPTSTSIPRLGDSILERSGLAHRAADWRRHCESEAAKSRCKRTDTFHSSNQQSLPVLVGAGVPEGARP